MVVESSRGYKSPLPVVDGAFGEAGEDGFRLAGPSLVTGQAGAEEGRVEAHASVPGGVRQPLGERQVIAPPGNVRGLQHEVGSTPAPLEPPSADPEDVLPSPCAGRFGELGQGPADETQPNTGDSQAEHVAVERVGQANL